MSVDMSGFKVIIKMVNALNFDDIHQAGVPNKYHELNLICDDVMTDTRYWIHKSFGEFHISYRKGINDIKKSQTRINCTNQKDVAMKLKEIVDSQRQ